jgi:hypothetical protein
MYHPVAVTVFYTCYNLIIHSTQIAQVTIWAKRIVVKLENNLKFLFCRERENPKPQKTLSWRQESLYILRTY